MNVGVEFSLDELKLLQEAAANMVKRTELQRERAEEDGLDALHDYLTEKARKVHAMRQSVDTVAAMVIDGARLYMNWEYEKK